MVFNATIINNSAILWQLVLLVKETRVLRENHKPAASDKRCIVNILPLAGFQLTTLVVIGTDCIYR